MLEVYKKIFLIRVIENKLDNFFKNGLINGTAHFCTGQEFIPVIISQYLEDDDLVTSTHRGHGHAIAKGLDVRMFMGELMGKRNGFNSGKAGSQHVVSLKNNYYANGVTGGMVPVAAGMAFANKYLGNDKVVVAYLGDGGFNEGYVQETLNIASVFSLPILFVCENNQYAMSTSVKSSHSGEIIDRVKSMNIKCEKIEINDYKKLDKISNEYIDLVRKIKIPCFIEVCTYRHKGHSKNDKNLYRDKIEEETWFNLDVLARIEKELKGQGYDEYELENYKNEIEKMIDKISEELISEQEEDKSDITDSVYSK